MSPFVIEHWPLLALGAALLSGGIGAAVGIIRAYRGLLDTIREIVKSALDSHTREEASWQREVNRRLERIETKVEDLSRKIPRESD